MAVYYLLVVCFGDLFPFLCLWSFSFVEFMVARHFRTLVIIVLIFIFHVNLCYY